jgi:hypothetical protein
MYRFAAVKRNAGVKVEVDVIVDGDATGTAANAQLVMNHRTSA